MVRVRDIVSSAVFYAGVVGLSALFIHVGSTYGWEKVDERFRLMEPKLTRGDYCWVNKRQCQPDQLTYGDIIMFTCPLRKRTGYTYEFARVLGKPGDVVAMRDHRLYRAERGAHNVLGAMEPVTEHYVQLHQRPEDFTEFVVPRNTVFVMFDDRTRRDALCDLLVPVRAIYGRVLN